MMEASWTSQRRILALWLPRLPTDRLKRRNASPGDGTLTLIFADNPLTLRQWTVLDAQRQETRVTLYNAETGGQFDQKLFQFIDPRALQPG